MALLKRTYMAGTPGKTKTPRGWAIWCSGCGHPHPFDVENGPFKWKFNNNQTKPTFTPQMIVQAQKENGTKITICNLQVTQGIAHFGQDCRHKLAGKSVALAQFPKGV